MSEQYVQSKKGTAVHIPDAKTTGYYRAACGYWLPKRGYTLVADPEIMPNCAGCLATRAAAGRPTDGD